jgi:hypothetical protein
MMTCQQVVDRSPVGQIDLQATDSIAATALPLEPGLQSFERPALIFVDFYTLLARLPYRLTRRSMPLQGYRLLPAAHHVSPGSIDAISSPAIR